MFEQWRPDVVGHSVHARWPLTGRVRVEADREPGGRRPRVAAPSDRGDESGRAAPGLAVDRGTKLPVAPDRSPVLVGATVRMMIIAGALAGLALSSQPSAASDQSSRSVAAGSPDSGAGAEVFASTCASCHQAGGVGLPGAYPPLAGNPHAADAAYVETVIREGKSGPIVVNGESFDQSMPAQSQLSDQEAADVAAYVASLAEGGSTDTTTPAEVPAEPGTVAGGKSLFIGSTRLENGGATCAGCHTAGSVGNFAARGLGPNLTRVADRLGGEAGLSGWLTNPASPTMRPIFTDRPLTPAEIADLTAFLTDAPSQNAPSRQIDWLVLAGVIGLAVLMAGMVLAYQGMRQTYAERLRTKSDVRAGARTTGRRS